MKLKKKHLIKTVTPLLEKMGYINLPSIDWEGLFGKKTSSQIYVTIGFTISNLYDDSFTADFYISTNTCCGAEWKGIPIGCRKFIKQLIEEDTIRNLGFDGDFFDGWFSCFDSSSLNLFFNVLPICEERFLSNEVIPDLMINSLEVSRMTKEYRMVINIFLSKGYVDKYEYQNIALACGIEQEWYNAAEYYCRQYLNLKKVESSVIRGYGQKAYQMFLLDRTFDTQFK